MNMCTKIITLCEKEENIANQRNPITREMIAALLDSAGRSESKDSIKAVIANWFTLIRITSLRCAEYAQKTQSAVDKHKYPSGRRVTKAVVPTDWKFYDKNGVTINVHPLSKDVQAFPTKL
jgi:hypothetical protein